MLMDSFVAFGTFGGRKIVLCDWSIVFLIDVQKGIHYLLGTTDFYFILGELESVHIIKCYLSPLERESVSCTDSAPSSWRGWMVGGLWGCYHLRVAHERHWLRAYYMSSAKGSAWRISLSQYHSHCKVKLLLPFYRHWNLQPLSNLIKVTQPKNNNNVSI